MHYIGEVVWVKTVGKLGKNSVDGRDREDRKAKEKGTKILGNIINHLQVQLRTPRNRLII